MTLFLPEPSPIAKNRDRGVLLDLLSWFRWGETRTRQMIVLEERNSNDGSSPRCIQSKAGREVNTVRSLGTVRQGMQLSYVRASSTLASGRPKLSLGREVPPGNPCPAMLSLQEQACPSMRRTY
jgi:hypothetical protein